MKITKPNAKVFIDVDRFLFKENLPSSPKNKKLKLIKIGDKLKLIRNLAGYGNANLGKVVEIVGFKGSDQILFKAESEQGGWNAQSISEYIDLSPTITPTTKLWSCYVSDMDLSGLEFFDEAEFKTELKTSLLRVGATQATKITKKSLLSVVKKQNISKPAYKLLVDLLDSSFGEALLAFAAGQALTKIDNTKAQVFAKELRVHGLATGGNAILDEVFKVMLPELGSVIQSLPTIEEVCLKQEETIYDEEDNQNVRVLSI